MERGRGRLYALIGAIAIAAALILWWGAGLGGRRAPSEDDLLASAGADRKSGGSSPSRPAKDPGARPPKGGRAAPGASGDATADELKDLRERRLAHATQTLESYLASTKYPPGSRPMSEQPDQDQPHSAPTVKLPLARADKKLTDARVTLRQDRFFVVGDESVTFTLQCETSDGPAPCEVLSSMARPRGASPGAEKNGPSAIVQFAPGGPGGVATAVFTPNAQGFEGYYGSIGVDIELRVDGETGGTGFDIQYTPRPPATFTGAVREAIEGGSLALYIGVDAVRAGRYVIQARVDDAAGRSFAYLSFNDELPAGRTEAKLLLFGKLILDEAAAAPFKLRDVEGFLLKEDTHPDRELMPSLDGPVLTTKPYTPREFSDSEWQSEEKARHVTEFRKDVDEAKGALESSGEP